MFKSEGHRRWLKKHKPGVAKKIEARSGNRVRFRKKRKGKRGKARRRG
jgi:hypothetical protein